MMKSEYENLPYVSSIGVKLGSMLVRQDWEYDSIVNFGIVISVDEPRVNLEPWTYTTVLWDTGFKTHVLTGSERVVSL